MPQQVNLFSGTRFQGLPMPFHLPKSIDWKVAGCFSLVAGCLILLALRLMRQVPNNSLGHSTSESSSLNGRVSQHEPDQVRKSESPEEEGAKETSSPTPVAKPSADVPRAVASQEVAVSRTAGKDGWTISSVNGEVTVSFSMNSNDVLDATKQRVTEKGGSVPDAFGEYKRWLKSEIFTVDGEEYYLSFRQNEENIDEMRFSLEKIKASNSTKADPSPLHLKFVYKAGNNEPQEGTKPLDFSKEKSLTILTPRRINRIAGENRITFTLIFLQPKTS